MNFLAKKFLETEEHSRLFEEYQLFPTYDKKQSFSLIR